MRLIRKFSKPFSVLAAQKFRFQSQFIDGRRSYGKMFEPEYLDEKGVVEETYDALNFQMKGYDFAVLESFAKYVHKTADRMDLEVEDSWATPSTNYKILKYKPETTSVDTEYLLNLYERNVQLTTVPATKLPLFVHFIEASMPAGITLRIQPHLQEHTEIRYVPDRELKKLRSNLDQMIAEREERKK